ncbi:DUF1857-domain-containing protein [Fistulina hepatica ATCC 64428]|uniref:DUF1857-domain-containing protein n=1 Tax=Fistulina hepatica ATCC 64428 TaxID=1128425 RepID=A0A0D7A9G5_9AGAR|nr:DUF1857-domain-containing protein [Fistulina hepatica ATCC 64428]
MKLHFAYTSPINSPGSFPGLTQKQEAVANLHPRWQVFRGLQIKARSPQAFVPAIVECQVISEDEKGLTREVKFKEGMGPPGVEKVTEVVTYYGEMKADFEQVGLDTHISNIISASEDGLQLTFTFSWNLPHLVEGSPEAQEEEAVLRKMSASAVKQTITQIRRMVSEGKL